MSSPCARVFLVLLLLSWMNVVAFHRRMSACKKWAKDGVKRVTHSIYSIERKIIINFPMRNCGSMIVIHCNYFTCMLSMICELQLLAAQLNSLQSRPVHVCVCVCDCCVASLGRAAFLCSVELPIWQKHNPINEYSYCIVEKKSKEADINTLRSHFDKEERIQNMTASNSKNEEWNTKLYTINWK